MSHDKFSTVVVGMEPVEDRGLKIHGCTCSSTEMDPRPFGLSQVPPRLFAPLTTGLGQYVDPCRLDGAQRERALETFGETYGFRIRATPKGGAFIKRAKAYKGETVELWNASHVALVAFPITPSDVLHYKPQEGTPFVAFHTLEKLGATPSKEDFLASDVLRATVDFVEDGRVMVRPRANDCGYAWTFVKFASAVRTYPSTKDALASTLYPGAVQSNLPTYDIGGLEGKWVTSADFMRVVVERIPSTRPEMTEEYFLAECNAKPVYAMLSKDLTLKKCTKNKAESSPFVSVQWLLKRKQAWMEGVLPCLGPANEDVPIVTGTHPEREGAWAKKASEGALKDARQSSVKMTLKSRLRDPAMESVLEAVVDSVSSASRYGSYLLNLHLKRTMDESKGVLFEDDPFTLDTTVRKAMASVRFKKPKHRGLAETVKEFPQLLGLVDPGLPETGNSLTEEAKMYKTTAHTTFQLAGPYRIATLVNSACKLYGVNAKGASRSIAQYVRGFGSLPAFLPKEVSDIAERYWKLYREKGLHDQYGFNVHHLSDECKKPRVRRILELYWHINRDLEDLEAIALRSGWTHAKSETEDVMRPQQTFEKPDSECPAEDAVKAKVWSRKTFTFLPISSLKRRHVRIDTMSFNRALIRVKHSLDPKLYDRSSFESIFITGYRRQDVRKIKKSKDWKMGRSFMTDGRSLVMTYVSKVESVPKQRGIPKLVEPIKIPEGARVVGDDPGRKNIHYTCERVTEGVVEDAKYGCDRASDGEGGFLEFKVLTRDDHYRGLDEVKRRGERRHGAKASEAIAELSSTRRRTTSSTEFVKYVQSMARWKTELKAAYGCRAACSEAFTNYRTKVGTMDRFIASFGASPEHPLHYALGDGCGGFASTGPGERAVPTSSYGVRIDKTFKGSIVRLPVDEFNTTKMDSVTMTELAPAWRKVEDAERRPRYIKDRDVRFCTSELLGSYHPCAAKPSLMEGLLNVPVGHVGVDRDRNAAFAILNLAGLRNDDRPPVYVRPN